MEGLSKGIANAGIKNRIRQIVVLLLVIFVGIVISHAVQAQSYHRAKARHYKAVYKSQIRNNSRACHILDKKRTEEPKVARSFWGKRKQTKYKPQAEMDVPTARSRKDENSTKY